MGTYLGMDISCLHLYGNSYIDPLKFGTSALTQEWVLARDTMVRPFYLHANIGQDRGGACSQDHGNSM